MAVMKRWLTDHEAHPCRLNSVGSPLASDLIRTPNRNRENVCFGYKKTQKVNVQQIPFKSGSKRKYTRRKRGQDISKL